MPKPWQYETDLGRVKGKLDYALRIISSRSDRYQGEEWSLLAGLVGDADLAMREMPHDEAEALRPLFEEVMTAFYELTKGFTRPDYLRSTRPARRDNPKLLNPR